MTKENFESMDFDKAMELLYEECNELTDYETLKKYIIKNINDDSNMLALHLLSAIYNSDGDSDWYYYDYTAGTLCTPVCLNNVDDVEQYIGFDKE